MGPSVAGMTEHAVADTGACGMTEHAVADTGLGEPSMAAGAADPRQPR
jgi:hypothetical protein